MHDVFNRYLKQKETRTASNIDSWTRTILIEHLAWTEKEVISTEIYRSVSDDDCTTSRLF